NRHLVEEQFALSVHNHNSTPPGGARGTVSHSTSSVRPRRCCALRSHRPGPSPGGRPLPLSVPYPVIEVELIFGINGLSPPPACSREQSGVSTDNPRWVVVERPFRRNGVVGAIALIGTTGIHSPNDWTVDEGESAGSNACSAGQPTRRPEANRIR